MKMNINKYNFKADKKALTSTAVTVIIIVVVILLIFLGVASQAQTFRNALGL